MSHTATFFCVFCNKHFKNNNRHFASINGEQIATRQCTGCALERRLNTLVNNWPITSKGELIAWAMSEN